ncbi:MAG: PspC domain-containing protein [Solirubrobacteraceae bacterium]|nr:PspC domain-containing protein [Solirubrobacteraceae bacterium]
MDPTHTAPPPIGPHPLGASLRRSSSDRLLLGLCGGVARSLDVSPTGARIATLLLGVILLPAAVLAYLVTAAILPADDETVLVGKGERKQRDVTTALLLTFIAAPLVIGAGAAWGLTSGPLVWPLLLVGAGAALGVALYRPATPGEAPSVAPTTAMAAGGTATPAETAVTAVVASDTASEADASNTGEAAEATAIQPAPPAPPSGPPTFVKHGDLPPHPPAGDPPPPSSGRRRGLALPVIALMAIVPAAFAFLYAVGAIEGGWDTWAIMLAVLALIAAGGAVAIAVLRPSYLGPALLVILAATLGTVSIAISQVGPLLDDGVGERTYRPQAVSEIEPVYVHGIGALTLDLRDLDLRRGSRTPIRVQLGLGEVVVAVPRGVRVVATPDSSLTDLTTSARRNGASDAASASAPTIVLDFALRGGNVRLVAGNATDVRNLELLAEQATGFWEPDGNDRFDAFRERPLEPATP